jgi:hypothetical protein
MKATLDGSYFKPAKDGSPAGTPGQLVFRYKVSGTKAELDAYKKAQGVDNYRETDDKFKTPLWFTVNPLPKQVTLGITVAKDGKPAKVFADNSELERLKLLAIAYPNLAADINLQMRAILFAAPATVSAPAKVSETAAPADLT